MDSQYTAGGGHKHKTVSKLLKTFQEEAGDEPFPPFEIPHSQEQESDEYPFLSHSRA